MKKTLLKERFQQLAGIKPLYENKLKDNQELAEDYSKGNELKDMVMDMDKQEYGNFIRMNVDSEAERPWAHYNDEVKEFLSDLGDDKAAIMQQIKAIKTGQYR
tara:strand:- start:1178 stop:1486 length:309 start_codon:yes stop_codon:yes gene_type:complete